MPTTRTFNRSFAGGELSPEMFGRIDDQKFQTGAAKMRNFIALPQGPAVNRPGTNFVREVKDSTKKTRLIPFTYSTTQTMVLEFGEGYIRFHTQGSTLLAGTGAAYNGATPYVVGAMVSYLGNNYYCILASTGNLPTNATYWYPIPSPAYEIPSPYLEADLFNIHYVQSSDVVTLVHPNYPPRELRRLGATQWTLVTISFASTVSAPTGLAVAVTLPAGTAVDSRTAMLYVVTAIGTELVDESAASAIVTSAVQNIFVTGAFNTISWTASAGATRYNVYKLQGGLFGYIGSTTGTSIIDDNIAPDLGQTPPIYDNDFVSAGNYPGAVSYYQQRRVFAGTTNAPQKIWMTKSGTESNFSYGLPLKDDDRIEFQVAAREANTIRHVVPLTQLLLLTGSAEWKVTSVNSDAITPTTISVSPQSYIGSNNVQPSIINNSMVYCAARGGHVRELGYSWQSNGYITGDLSLRAAHLFDNYEISDMCYSKSPHPIVWFVSSAGLLLGLTYVPEQQIGAWHQHDTDGLFESCTSVAEGTEDHVYVVVKRTVNGNSVRYVERMASNGFDSLEDCFFVDSGLTYDGNNTTATTVTVSGGTLWGPTELLTITASTAIFAFPALTDIGDAFVFTATDGTQYRLTIEGCTSTTVVQARPDKVLATAFRNVATTSYGFARNTLSGFSHLEGKTVSILADGAVLPSEVVVSGSITIERAAVKIHVGLQYFSDLQTLPLAINIEAFGQGRVKNINQAWVRVFRSSGLFVGPTADKLTEAKMRTNEPYGSPPSLRSDEISVNITPTWAQSGQIYIRQADPLPLTVVGVTIEAVVGA